MNKRTILCHAILIAILSITGCQAIKFAIPTASVTSTTVPKVSPTMSPMAKGIDYFNHEEYAAAILTFKKITADDPQNVEAYLYIGRSFLYLGKPDNAMEAFVAANKLDAANDGAYRGMGQAYMNQRKLDNAFQSFNKAIAVAPKTSKNYEWRSYAFLVKGDTSSAYADASKAVEVEPSNPDALNSLCWAGSFAGKAKEALESCNKALSLAPDRWEIMDSRGLARAMSGDLKGAAEDFQKSVDIAQFKRGTGDFVPERKAFITELQKGNNPFDEATLKKLREE